MRIVSYGKTFVDNVTVDTKLSNGQLGICTAYGTALPTTGRPESFVIMSAIPTKDGEFMNQRGVDINPFNFTYNVRKYTEKDQKETIILKGLTNPALKPAEGIVYNADAEFCGAIEICSSEEYRQGLTVNPNPQIVQIPVRIHATDTVDRLVEKIKKNLSLTAYNKELFDITIEKADGAVQITVVAKKPTKLTMNVFGILADQKANGTITVEHTKLSGFLADVALSDEDLRYSLINMGWNPHDEWQKAWGIGDPKVGFDKVAYLVISTAEFNQFPEIAADNNSPRKFQIIVGTEAVIDAVVDKLEAIKTLAKGSGDNAISLNTATD